MNFTNLLFETVKEEKCILHLKKIFGGADLADMSQISKFNKGIKFLLCVIDLFSRYAWVVGQKNKKGDSIVGGFQSILNNSDRKLNKI